MRIVVVPNSNPSIVGIASALATIEGVQIAAWEPSNKPAMDMFDELQPELLVCESKTVNQEIQHVLREHPDTKTILFGVSTANINPAIVCFPNIMTEAQVKMVARDKFPVTQIQFAANVAQLYKGDADPNYKSDLLLISDEVLGEDKLQILSEYIDKYRVRVIGPARIPVPQYVGLGNIRDMVACIKSTKIGLDLTGKYAYDFAMNKIPCLSPNKEISIDTIEPYLENTKKRRKHINEAYQATVSANTYYHRVHQLFSAINMNEIADKSLETLERIINDK